jgi:DNA-binding PadR family transcriptional regulator
MSLPHALLTALTERPCSGSELAERFDRTIGYFWQATHQHIYRELARLEADGYIKGSPVQGARGGKKQYRILPAGRKELTDWVTSSLSTVSVRDELMVRLRAEAVIGPTDLVSELSKLAVQHRQKLAIYHEIEVRDFQQSHNSVEQSLRYLVLKAGIDFESRRVAFCEEAIALLQKSPR